MVGMDVSAFGINAGVDVSTKGINTHLNFGGGGAAAVFSRTLTFRTNNLGTDATLMLTFDSKKYGIYDTFPVCWKVTRFAAAGPYHITVTYQSQIAFCKPQVDHAADIIVDAGTFQKINVGQKTTLTKDTNGVYNYSPAEADAGSTTLKAYNGTQLREDMGVGFLRDGDFAPTPVLFFEGIRAGSFVQADFTPILHAYVTSQYRETQIIRTEVSTPIIWEQNLATLDNTTTWDVKFDANSGKFTITQV